MTEENKRINTDLLAAAAQGPESLAAAFMEMLPSSAKKIATKLRAEPQCTAAEIQKVFDLAQKFAEERRTNLTLPAHPSPGVRQSSKPKT